MINLSLDGILIPFIIMELIFMSIYLSVLSCINKYYIIINNDKYLIDSKIIDLDAEIYSHKEKHKLEISDEETKKNEKIESEKINIDNRTKEIIKYIHKEREKLDEKYAENKTRYQLEVENFQYNAK